MIIKLLVEGADMKPGPAIAQQLGPMGINMGKVISEVNSATKEFKGMKVPVEIDVDKKTKTFEIKTFSPPTAELLKKDLKLEKGSDKIKTTKVGNASIEDIIKIAKIKQANMLEKDFKSAVKSILGTCAAMGALVENKEPKEILEEVVAGKFDKEIQSQISETPTEKRKTLDDYFNKIKSEQDARIAREQQVAKEAEEAKAQAAAAPATAKTEGAKAGAGSAAGAKPEAAKPAAKKEEKKK